MKFSALYIAPFLLLSGVLYSTTVPAADNSSALWLNVARTGSIGETDRSKWLYTLQGEYRAFGALEGVRQIIGRVGVGYRLPRGFSIWLRYDHHHTELTELGTLNENRLQQVVNWTGTGPGETTIKLRGILEQRWLENQDETGLRLRFQARLEWPMSTTGNAMWVAWLEPFYDLRSVGPADSGWNQNRAFIGASLPSSSSTRIELGYMNQWADPFGGRDLMSHTLLAQLRF